MDTQSPQIKLYQYHAVKESKYKSKESKYWMETHKINIIQRTQHAWGILNRGHERYLHFRHWLHSKSTVQTISWSWKTKHTKIMKIDTPMHVPWSLDIKILKIDTPMHIPLRNMRKKLKVRLKYKGYFTQIFDLFLEYKKLFMN